MGFTFFWSVVVILRCSYVVWTIVCWHLQCSTGCVQNILYLSVGVIFVYHLLPNIFRSPKMFSIRCGCVRWIEPSSLRSMFTPRKTSRVPSSVISNFALRICLSISSVSVGYSSARMESSVYVYMTFPV